jgi:hypothetical protein
MAIFLDEHFPFRLHDGSEMPERLEVELAISGGRLVVTPLNPRPSIVEIFSLFTTRKQLKAGSLLGPLLLRVNIQETQSRLSVN